MSVPNAFQWEMYFIIKPLAHQSWTVWIRHILLIWRVFECWSFPELSLTGMYSRSTSLQQMCWSLSLENCNRIPKMVPLIDAHLIRLRFWKREYTGIWKNNRLKGIQVWIRAHYWHLCSSCILQRSLKMWTPCGWWLAAEVKGLIRQTTVNLFPVSRNKNRGKSVLQTNILTLTSKIKQSIRDVLQLLIISAVQLPRQNAIHQAVEATVEVKSSSLGRNGLVCQKPQQNKSSSIEWLFSWFLRGICVRLDTNCCLDLE